MNSNLSYYIDLLNEEEDLKTTHTAEQLPRFLKNMSYFIK